MKQNISIFPMLIMSAFLVFASSCEKDDDNDPSSNNPTNGKTTAVFNPNATYGTMTDQDGNVYKTVTIGTQTWMAENLRTTKYNDGTAIPTGDYCSYDNTTSIDTIATYGRLYNWYAVNSGKLAPNGWHVPTDAEWTTLETYLGGSPLDGPKLKEIGTTHWSTNIGATNESGFTALPGGLYNDGGSFEGFGHDAYWWSDTELNPDYGMGRNLYYDRNSLTEANPRKVVRMSVRCVKD